MDPPTPTLERLNTDALRGRSDGFEISHVQSTLDNLNIVSTNIAELLTVEDVDDEFVCVTAALKTAASTIQGQLEQYFPDPTVESIANPEVIPRINRAFSVYRAVLNQLVDAIDPLCSNMESQRGKGKSLSLNRAKEPSHPSKQLLIKLTAEEGNYVAVLTSIINYSKAMEMEREEMNILAADAKKLFSNSQELSDLHNIIYNELKFALKKYPESNVGALILSKLPQLKTLYQQYILTAAEINQIYDKLTKENKSFSNLLKSMEKKEGNLQSHLLRPLRRMEEYMFSLEAYNKALPPTSHEKAELDECIDTLQDLLDSIEQRESVAGNLEKVMEIGMSIEGLEENIVRPDRRFIYEGPLKLTPDGAKKPVADYGFLFNDVLFYTTLVGKTNTYVGRMYMHTLSFQDSESKNTFAIQVGEKDKFHAATPKKEEWLLYLGKVIREVERTRKVFGVPLKVLMNREKDSDIPAIVERAIKFIYDYGLQKEGIFRQTGRSTQIEKLKDQLNQGAKVFFSENMDVHSVAVLFKVWLRELPEPLLTWKAFSEFMRAITVYDDTELIEEMQRIAASLPRAHRFVAQHMMKCLKAICANESKTKMNPGNLAVVFAPNILRNPDSSVNPFDPTYFERVNDVFKTLLENYDQIWGPIEQERSRKMAKKLKKQIVERVNERSQRKHSKDFRGSQEGMEGVLAFFDKKKWSNRHVSVKQNLIQVSKSTKAEKKVKNSFALKASQVSSAPASPKPFSFTVRVTGAEFLFSAKTSDEQDEWMAAILLCTPE